MSSTGLTPASPSGSSAGSPSSGPAWAGEPRVPAGAPASQSRQRAGASSGTRYIVGWTGRLGSRPAHLRELPYAPATELGARGEPACLGTTLVDVAVAVV